MQFSSFNWNPAELSKNEGFNALSRNDKGLLLEVLSLMWQSDKQFILHPTQHVLDTLKAESVEIDSLVSKLANHGILDSQLCFEVNDVVLHSKILEKSFKQQHMKALRDEQITKKMMKSQQDSNSLYDSINEKKRGHEYAIGFLAPHERDISTFKNWMPTARFDTSGQVYFVRTFFKEQLTVEFPTLDVDFELKKIFNYLVENPMRRKNISYMNKFVKLWLSNAANPNFVSGKAQTPSDNIESIEDELDKLIAQEVAV